MPGPPWLVVRRIPENFGDLLKQGYAAVVNIRPDDDGYASALSSTLRTIIKDVSAWPAYDLF